MASSADNSHRMIKRADPSTIQDKFLVGYQGWFTCQGDGEPVGPGHHGWLHWFNHPLPDGGHPNTDLWPDVSSYPPSELYPAPGLRMKSGEQAFLFSSRNGKTVQRHFHWMAEHGIDGAFLQRFAGQTDVEVGNEGIRRIRDEVGDRVREAAEEEGRVFAIMYDVSGVPADRIAQVLERDWTHLMRDRGVLDSPNYLKEKGKPVVALWGFGFDGSGHTPALVRGIVAYFRRVTPGGVYIMAGVPAHWRTSEGDADRNPEFVDVWLNEFDAISPWTIGRYTSELEADNFAETKMKGDSELIKRRVEEGRKKVDYLPVVFPGGSGYNTSEGKLGWNNIKRNGGRFLWKQIYNARKLGVRTIYGAMWDEYDEGTALIPVVPYKRLLPESDNFHFLALDEDGYDLPPDWYMRICGFAAEALRSERRIFETFPSKELQDYWASRPKYEDPVLEVKPSASGSASGVGSSKDSGGASGKDGGGQSYEEWLAGQNEDKDELPPPPYSLEAEEAPATTPAVTVTSGAASATVAPAAPAPAVAANPISTPAAAPVPASTTQTLPVSGPPAVNTSTYPGQHNSGINTPDPVASLTNDFGRTHLSPSPSQQINTGAGLGSSFSPPPLHPSHPAAAGTSQFGYGRPQVPASGSNPSSRPQSPPRPISAAAVKPQPNLSTHPVPHDIHSMPSQQQQQQESGTPGPWSQAVWPPPEWGMNPNNNNNNANTPTTTTQYPVYNAAGALGGANLSRPSSYSAGHHAPPSAGGANLRPSATIGGGAGSRPSYGGSPASPSGPSGQGPFFPSHTGPAPVATPGFITGPGTPVSGLGPYHPGAMSSYPGQGPTSPYPPHGGPGMPMYPGQQTSPLGFPGQPTPSSSYPGQGSTYPGQQTYHPRPGQHHSSPPQSPSGPAYPPPSSTSTPGAGTGQQGYQPSYQTPPTHGHASHAPHGTSSPPAAHGGVHFPQGPGDYGMGVQSYPGGPGYSSYPPQSQHGSSGYGSSPGPSAAAPHGGPMFPQAPGSAPLNGAGGQWTAGGPPSRPNTSSRPSSSGFGFPTASPGGGPMGLAMSTVDKIAGKKVREQVESQVGNITQVGSKLFNKFK